MVDDVEKTMRLTIDSLVMFLANVRDYSRYC